jgi:hypothetical protein
MLGELWELEMYAEMQNFLIQTTTIHGNTIDALMDCVLGEFMILKKNKIIQHASVKKSSNVRPQLALLNTIELHENPWTKRSSLRQDCL